MSPAAHRRPADILLDVDDAGLRSALDAAFRPHRVHVVGTDRPAAAVAAVADRTADVVVVAPRPDVVSGPDQVHRRVALRAGWWVDAAAVVGAHVVLVAGTAAFDGDPAVATAAPDEFSRPAPATSTGRAWRAAEAQVVAGGGSVVRAGWDDAPAAVAGLVRWAAGARAGGTWHLPGTADLDTRHTRLVRDGDRGEDDDGQDRHG